MAYSLSALSGIANTRRVWKRQAESRISTAAHKRGAEYAFAEKATTMKPQRLFILRYSPQASQFWDFYFLTLEEHLPGGTINQFEPDDVYRTFTESHWEREHIEFLLYQGESTVAQTRRRATWMRYLKGVVQRIASIPADEWTARIRFRCRS